ncbi:MAG TPA: NAD(P)/FAD-dependent oxidoreductase [Clostridiaceae bacterium]|nr:NAD(P)/FAD-dependent oxidoreductase [Clostridiaceae bacterium]
MEKIDMLIIGAGVVGLAITAELTSKFEDSTIVLLEKHDSFGRETSSRNSEVIHSGIYYPVGSLKAKLCVEGKKLLYDFCNRRKVPYSRIGKLIVAKNEQEAKQLETLFELGRENGVTDLEILDRKQVTLMEPNVKAEAAIFSPSTGIIDSHVLMERLESIAKQNFALLAYEHEVKEIHRSNNGYVVVYRMPNGDEDRLECRIVVNCAGLNSDTIAAMAGIDIDSAGYRIFLCKGEYFSVNDSKSNMVSHLIYPVPHANLEGLGIHVTKSLDGRIRLGPNAFYVDKPDYDVNRGHAEIFFNSAREFLPFLELNDLEADMSGIRPKIQGPGDPVKDFVIRHEADRGLPGFINLVGIESPGLTSSLSIAKMVADMIKHDDIV